MRKLAILPVAIATALSTSAVSHAATVEELEERLIKVEKSQKRANYRVRSVKREINERDQKFRINGFMQAGVAATSNTDTDDYGLDVQSNKAVVYNDPSFEGQTLFGVQMTMKINDKAEAVTQIVARGGEDFRAQMEWAYFRYHLTDSWTLRAGRLRTPFFALSEYLEVGYAQPWVRPPTEVYGNNIANYNGMDIEYRTRLGEVNTSTRVFYGSKDSPVGGFDVRLDNLLGLRFEANYRSVSFFASYSEANLNIRPDTLPDPVQLSNELAATVNTNVAALNTNFGLSLGSLASLPNRFMTVEDGKGSFGSIGISYDDGVWNISTEARALGVEGTYQDDQAHYVSIARRFGDWTPYFLYSRLYTDDDHERDTVNAQLEQWKSDLGTSVATLGVVGSNPALTAPQQLIVQQAAQGFNEAITGIGRLQSGVASLTGEQRSYAIGTRWDFAENMALKFEYLMVRDIESSPDISTRNDGVEGEELDAVTLVFNAVF